MTVQWLVGCCKGSFRYLVCLCGCCVSSHSGWGIFSEREPPAVSLRERSLAAGIKSLVMINYVDGGLKAFYFKRHIFFFQPLAPVQMFLMHLCPLGREARTRYSSCGNGNFKHSLSYLNITSSCCQCSDV